MRHLASYIKLITIGSYTVTREDILLIITIMITVLQMILNHYREGD